MHVQRWRNYYGAQQKKRAIKYTLFIAAALVIIVAFLYFTGQFGVSDSKMEANARKAQMIDENWLCVKASENDVTAMLFYDEVLGDYKVAIYGNPEDRPGDSYLLYGATSNAENEGVAEYLIDGSGERVYMSMNLQNAVRNERFPAGKEKENTELKTGVPFVYVMPDKGESVRFYDEEGTELSIFSQTI